MRRRSREAILALSFPALLMGPGEAEEVDPVLQPGIVEEVTPTREPSADPVLQPGIVEEIPLSLTDDPLEQGGIVREIPIGSEDAADWTEAATGRSPIRFALRVEGYFDDNVFIASSAEQDDFVWEIFPEVFYESSAPEDRATHYFSAGYNPQAIIFSDIEGIDAFNNRGFARYWWNGDRIVIRTHHRSDQFSETSRDVGSRTEGDRHLTLVSGEYRLSGASAVEASLGQRLRNYDRAGLADSKEWWFDALLVAEVSSKIELGAGPRFGRFDIDGAPDQTYQKAQLRARYAPSGKLTVEAGAGADFRQFEDPGGAGNEVTPEFELEVAWRPSDATTIAVTGFRRLTGSVSGQNFVTTGAEAGVRQRLLGKFNFDFSAGYEHAVYESTRSAFVAFREDDYYYVHSAIEVPVGDRVTVGLFHRFETNDSNTSLNYDQNQFGFVVEGEY